MLSPSSLLRTDPTEVDERLSTATRQPSDAAWRIAVPGRIEDAGLLLRKSEGVPAEPLLARAALHGLVAAGAALAGRSGRDGDAGTTQELAGKVGDPDRGSAETAAAVATVAPNASLPAIAPRMRSADARPADAGQPLGPARLREPADTAVATLAGDERPGRPRALGDGSTPPALYERPRSALVATWC